MAPSLALLVLLMAPLTPALPIVDPGLFVILGVQSCRQGNGYCILGNNCTLDEDFLPDDRGGHCNGLRSAFTPSADFICCRYNAETPSPDDTTVTTPIDDVTITTTDATTTDADAITESAMGSGDLVKRTRIDDVQAENRFLVTVSEIPPSARTENFEPSNKIFVNKNFVSSLSEDDIFKLITEGEWQINEVGDESPGDTTTEVSSSSSYTLPPVTDAFVEKEIIVAGTQPPEDITTDNVTTAEEVFESVCVGDPVGDGDGDCWFARFVDTRSGSVVCLGAFVDASRVLTSAVCAIRIFEADLSHVGVQRSPGGESLSLKGVAVHEDFGPKDSKGKRHDVGLVLVNGNQSSRSGCSLCLAAPEQTLEASNCFTFTGNIGNETKHPCREIGSLEEDDGKSSITCSLSENNDQVPSGVPLVCGRTLAGVAFSSPKGPTAFTPSAQLLPWVRWNLEKTIS